MTGSDRLSGRFFFFSGSLSFEPNSGRLNQIIFHDREFLASSPKLNVWRAPTDNDGVKAWIGNEEKNSSNLISVSTLQKWMNLGLHKLKLTNQICKVSEDFNCLNNGINSAPKQKRFFNLDKNLKNSILQIEVEHQYSCGSISNAFIHYIYWHIFPDLTIWMENKVVVHEKLSDLPRIGISFQLQEGFEEFKWFGNGPHESYCDRLAGVRVGCFNSTVNDQYVPYIVPQEHGNKTGLRWITLKDGDLSGITISSSGLFEGSVSHFSDEMLFSTSHAFKLKPCSETFVYLDHRQRGLGTGSCGPDTLEKYIIHSGNYHFDFLMKPFDARNSNQIHHF